MLINYKTAKNIWNTINQILHQYQYLWKLKPFEFKEIPWRDKKPNLAKWVQKLTREEIKTLSGNPILLNQAIYSFLPVIRDLDSITGLKVFPGSINNIPKGFEKGIKGRKWEQIKSFANCLPEMNLPVIEWCSGKSHLGRIVALTRNLEVTGLEIDQILCESGNKLSRGINIHHNVEPVDVLSDKVLPYLKQNSHIIALHACGLLHHRLLELLPKKNFEGISLSPCCFHRINYSIYRCFSNHLKGFQTFQLDRHDLHLPLQDVVVASGRVTERRELETTWRLAFDSLQREVLGRNNYLNVPSVPNEIMRKGFKEFAIWASNFRQIPLPDDKNLLLFEKAGQKRRSLFSRIELIRYIFRRALEMWLALDIVLYLIEKDYQVKIGEFCERKITPRNILISGTK